MANVVFLWHMHQPYYVDPATQTAVMPWVRLHSVKGYLDMISVIEDFPGIRVNFNLTPVLMLQIKELVEGKITDRWLEWARRPAEELSDEEKFALLENSFKAHWDNMVKPFPRYWELLNKRGLTFYPDDVRRGLRYFSAQEFRDLQTWFNLAWCGYTAERSFPEISELKRKGRGFTEEEKLRVLQIHLEIMALLPGKYRAAEERGQVELTTTPFFHPILPLIYDSSFAERNLPGREFPKRFHRPEDAAAHLTLAVEQHAALFGKPPRGLWPSEGSIAPELIPLMQKSGIQYFCSDEENLFKSIKNDAAYSGRNVDHLELFQGWRVAYDGAAVNAVFREKPLSDFIGFMAARNSAKAAADHLLHHLRHISSLVPLDSGVIPLILDGENAWETFADGGEAFLRALYGGIEASRDRLHSCTIEDYFNHHPPKKQLSTLHTGSWICSNFDIWIGDPEENRAWNLLGETRDFLQQRIDAGTLSPEQKAAALREVYAAEGSDWFWWYGPDFTTDNDALFDALFRQHLKNIYVICGALPPADLDIPLITAHIAPLCTPPRAQIQPAITGKVDTFFEWEGAGSYLPGSEQSAMYRSERLLRRIHFGSDEENLYLRFDVHRWEAFSLALEFYAPTRTTAETGPIVRGKTSRLSVRAEQGSPKDSGAWAAQEIVELSLPLSALGIENAVPVSFQVRLFKEGIERERYPENVPIEFALPGPEFALENWVV